MRKIIAKAGKVSIGGDCPIVIQTMCNTHTADEDATVAQCIRLAQAGAELIRITVPGPSDVQHIKAIKSRLADAGVDTPIVADIHFSSQTAIAVAPYVEKVRINPGNFHRDHDEACRQFSELVKVCKENGTAIRIGLNHGSLGERITKKYGNTPEAMCNAALEWLDLCEENGFENVVVSLKSSNTIVMIKAYRLLFNEMQKRGTIYPLHVGVTEAGNGDSGRIKSCVGTSSLLEDGIGDTIRVSLTEDPENELPVARYLADRYDGRLKSSMVSSDGEKNIRVDYAAPSRERLLMDFACDFAQKLTDRKIDSARPTGTYMDEKSEIKAIDSAMSGYLEDELLQACRRRFYKPEYIACPGCGRTMYDLQKTFEEVKAKTAHLKDVVIAVMGCIVNGPGEMADADWGYVGEGNHKVTIYHKCEPVLRHVPDTEAVDILVSLIEKDLPASK